MQRRLTWWSAWAVALALCGCGGDRESAEDSLEPERYLRIHAPESSNEEMMPGSAQPDGAYSIKRRGGPERDVVAVPTTEAFAETGALAAFSSSLDDGEMYGGWGVPRAGGVARHSAVALRQGSNAEDYTDYGANPATVTTRDRLSTFAIDVDTASYSIVRRKLLERRPVPASAVRVEEFVNYFHYDYPGPTGDSPFAVHMDAAPSPFDESKHLLRVGVQGRTLSRRERKPAHLVFLVDVSGSMATPDKLELAKRSLEILVDNLNDGDTVALVTYAGRVEKVLDPTGLEHREQIRAAIDGLRSGGGTSMGSGMELAYQLAARTLSEDTVSRVIVLSDGDANIGRATHQEILDTVAGYVKEGVTLSTIGFGMGNYKDTMMEQLANRGNGNYFYVDSIQQARRVFQDQLGAALEVIAKDVKIQVELHEDAVASYRLVGYENRDIADDEFRNDRVDAGEIGAGHSVTALYEVTLTGRSDVPLATVRLRAKPPRGEKASESVFLFDRDKLAPRFSAASADFRFAVAVMGAAEILRRSPYAARWKMATVIQLATEAFDGSDERAELVQLMRSIES